MCMEILASSKDLSYLLDMKKVTDLADTILMKYIKTEMLPHLAEIT